MKISHVLISFMLVFMSLTAVLAVQMPRTVEITPHDPYPSENLLCRYLNYQRGDILEFWWVINGETVDRLRTDKPSTIFNAQGKTRRGDAVLCVVNQVFEIPREHVQDRGSDTVVIGNFQCNDGLDNDGDNQIDSRDQDCSVRSDDLEGREPVMGEEIVALCREHPDSFFCLGMGYLDLQRLCTAHPDNHLCGILPSNDLDPICRQDPNHLICTGHNDPSTYCINMNDIFCRNFLLGEVIFRCERNNQCMEVNHDDKDALCELDGSYDFCPAEFRANAGGLGGPCVDVPCGAGLFCSEDLVCVQQVCQEDARRQIGCRGGVQTEQVCKANHWVGECPPFVCEPGDTRTIDCPDTSHLVQGCLNNRWVGACPEDGEESEEDEEQDEERDRERREGRRLVPLPPLPPGQQADGETPEEVLVNVTGQEAPELSPIVCGDGVCSAGEICEKDCPEETPIQLPMTGILAVIFIIAGFGVGALVGHRFLKKSKKR